MNALTRSELRLGGVALIVGGALLATGLTLLALVPSASTPSVASWAAHNAALLAASDELISFAVLALAPALVLLHRPHAPLAPARSLVVSTTGAIALVALVTVVLFVGRLVYPIPGLPLSDDTAALAVATYVGAQHLFALLLAWALLVVCTIQRGARRVLAVVAGVLMLPAAYPWLIPAWLEIAAAAALLLWCAASGAHMLRGLEPRHGRGDDRDQQGRDAERHEGGQHADAERDHEAHPEHGRSLLRGRAGIPPRFVCFRAQQGRRGHPGAL